MQINPILTLSADCVICSVTGETKLKFGVKWTINWNKCQSNVVMTTKGPYLDYEVVPSFQSVNRLFVFLFENNNDRKAQARYFLPRVEVKYNRIINGQNVFDQTVKNGTRTCNNIASDQSDDYTAVCLLYYPHFKERYKLIAIDLSKKQVLDADPKATQQINFTGDRDGNTAMFFIIEEAKETILDFLQGTVKVVWIYFALI